MPDHIAGESYLADYLLYRLNRDSLIDPVGIPLFCFVVYFCVYKTQGNMNYTVSSAVLRGERRTMS